MKLSDIVNTIDIQDELHHNFIDFAYEANSQRAFPSASDGLKPGQRACLWEFYTKGYKSSKPHVKCAKIAGGVIAAWHPHGDVAIYDTFTRMSQPWINNIPEVDFHGLNGNIIIGPEAASSRYTEARLSKAAEQGLFEGIKKNNVPMVLNFLEEDYLPSVLPAIFPRLYVNGSQGIGVTIAQTWLPGNLNEFYEVIKRYIEEGILDYSSLAPDFPTGGIIINKDELSKIYETGKGKVILRAKTEIKDNHIFITELPYQTYVEPLIDELKKYAIDNNDIDIVNIYNKSDKKRLLIDIECGKGANVNFILHKLFKETNLQKNFNANQFALVSKTPELLTFKDYVHTYIEHNYSCIRKEYEFDLQKAKDRQEILEGLIKALVSIDEIINLIKKSNSSKAAIANLQLTYDFTERQAAAIVGMKLGSLAKLESVELNKELQEKLSIIENCNNILSNEDACLHVLLDRLAEFTKKFGWTRRTQLTQETIVDDKEIEIVPEDVVVIMTETGYIKRVPKKSFKVQRKAGKGVKNQDDVLLDTIAANTQDTLLLFSSLGKMYKLSVNDIAVGTNTAKGVYINNLIKIDEDNNEKIIAISLLNKEENKDYVVFFTKKGLVKKTYLEEYTQIKRKTGVAAIKLKEGDSLSNVVFMNEEDVVIITKQGMSIYFSTEDIKPIGRMTSGVQGIKLAADDEVLGGFPIIDGVNLAIVTKTGYGKQCIIEESLTLQGRGGKGSKISEDPVAGCELITNEDNLLLVGYPNSICISCAELPIRTRTGAGNIMSKNNVMTIAKI